jgi:hypothetical protein
METESYVEINMVETSYKGNQSVEKDIPKEGFFKRNAQIFRLGLILIVIFTAITLISLFLPRNQPELVPVENEETPTQIE